MEGLLHGFMGMFQNMMLFEYVYIIDERHMKNCLTK